MSMDAAIAGVNPDLTGAELILAGSGRRPSYETVVSGVPYRVEVNGPEFVIYVGNNGSSRPVRNGELNRALENFLYREARRNLPL